MSRASFIKTFIVSLIITTLVGLIGILAFPKDMSWYQASKPSFSPPNYLFGIVWPILYILIALSLALVWISANKRQKNKVAQAYGLNLAANALWTPLFFGFRLPLIAFVDIAVIWSTIVWMIFLAKKIDKRASWLLLPYLLWVTFAAILNLYFL